MVNRTVSSEAIAKWKASLTPGNIVPIHWHFSPIYDLIVDTAIRANVHASIDDYITDQRNAWNDLDKCPPRTSSNKTCSGHGTCHRATKCTCTSVPPNPGCKVSPATGRMCSVGGSFSGTRPISATWGTFSRDESIGCADSRFEFEFEDSKEELLCSTDSDGRVQAKLIFQSDFCTGPWSASNEKGMSSTAFCGRSGGPFKCTLL